ncbi:MAG: hypothetical protein WC590_08695 [Burkholderiaceae bacterium]
MAQPRSQHDFARLRFSQTVQTALIVVALGSAAMIPALIFG